jgi:hypothetical protein
MKDNPLFRGFIASVIAVVGLCLLFAAIDHDFAAHPCQFGFAIGVIGASGGSLWRSPLIGAACAAVCAVFIVFVVLTVWYFTWIPLL